MQRKTKSKKRENKGEEEEMTLDRRKKKGKRIAQKGDEEDKKEKTLMKTRRIRNGNHETITKMELEGK